MEKPIIGIIGKVQPQYGEDIWHRIDETDEIRYLIVKNGGIAIKLLPTEATLKFNDNDTYDGLVESFELDNKKFILGIKWHPELMLEDNFTQNLFSEFIKFSKI